MNDFLKKFNCPGRFFEVLGYVTVIIGLVIMVVGIVGWATAPNPFEAEDDPVVYPTQFLSFIPIGLVVAIVCPQLFFAIAKIVRAAEKYLGE